MQRFEDSEIIKRMGKDGFEKFLPLIEKSQLWLDKAVEADRIEVCALAQSKVASGENTFPLRPYLENPKGCDNAHLRILTRETLSGSAANTLTSLVSNVDAVHVYHESKCHEPPYGLRFFELDELLLESSFCWKCWNFGHPSEHGYTWGVFDAGSSQARDLLSHLQSVVPHPDLAD